MGIFKKIKEKAAPVVGSFFGPLGTAAGSAIGGALGGRIGDKIDGIPTPTGTEAGNFARNYYQAAFPGTNVWDHIRAGNPGGQIQSQFSAARTVERVARRQRGHESSIADRNNRAHLLAAAAPYGPQAASDMLELYRTGGRSTPQPWDTPIRQARERLPEEILKLSAEHQLAAQHWRESVARTELTGSEAEIQAARAKAKNWIVGLGLARDATDIILRWVGVASGIGFGLEAARQWRNRSTPLSLPSGKPFDLADPVGRRIILPK